MARPWSKSIQKPRTGTELSEFIGIMMGDGGISAYQVMVSLHHLTDYDYALFVQQLAYRLFGVMPCIYHIANNSVINLVISRVQLVRYLTQLGLPMGNKTREVFDIPTWIQKNPTFLRACIRGLVDTDGSVFTHRYLSKGRWYAYKKLSFTSVSSSLRSTVHDTLNELGIRARYGSNNDIRIDSKADMERYFSLIGTSNPKHLRRYRS